MPESSLSLTYDEIRRLVGERRGYGLTVDEWSDDSEKVSIVEDCLKTGARMFYNQSSHDWSFMKPIASFVVPSDANEVILPEQYGFLIGRLYFESDAGFLSELRVENAAKVLWRRMQDSTTTGQPLYAAMEERAPGATHGQRKFLIFWPTSDQPYTVTGQFSILAEALSTSEPHPWGGSAHAETIKNACLAASEQRDGQFGIQSMLYERAIRASIEYDKRVKPQELTSTDGRFMERRATYVTYTPGIQY